MTGHSATAEGGAWDVYAAAGQLHLVTTWNQAHPVGALVCHWEEGDRNGPPRANVTIAPARIADVGTHLVAVVGLRATRTGVPLTTTVGALGAVLSLARQERGLAPSALRPTDRRCGDDGFEHHDMPRPRSTGGGAG